MIAITKDEFESRVKDARLVAIRHNGETIIELKFEESGQEYEEDPVQFILQVEANLMHGEFERLEVTVVGKSRWYLS